MAQHIVLQRFVGVLDGQNVNHAPAALLDDRVDDIAALRAGGAALVEYNPATMAEARAAFLSSQGSGSSGNTLVATFHAFAVFPNTPGAGTGDVEGPATSTDGAVARWDGTLGSKLQDGPTIGTGPNELLQLDGSGRLPGVDGSQLTNLPGGQDPASGIASGSLVTADGGGKLQAAGARELDDRFVFDKAAEFPPGSVLLGPNVRLSAVAERLGVTDEIAAQRFLTLSQAYDLTGSEIPEYLDLGADTVTFDQPLSDITVAAGATFEVSSTPAQATFSAIQNAISLLFEKAISDFRVRVWEGTDDTGTLVIDHEFGALAPGFQRLNYPAPYGFREGVGYFVRYSTQDAQGLGLLGTDLGGGVLFPRFQSHTQRITRIDLALAAIIPDVTTGNRNFAREEATRIFRYSGATSATWVLPEGAALFDGWYVWISQQATADVPLTLQAAGSDTFEGGASTLNVTRDRIALAIWSETASVWSVFQFMEAGATPTVPDLAGDVTGPIASNTVARIQGRAVVDTAPTDGQIFVFRTAGGQSWRLEALPSIPATLPPSGAASGDLGGAYPGPTVEGLRGRPVASVAPAAGDVLRWNGTAWAPQSNEELGNLAYARVKRVSDQQLNGAQAITQIVWDSEQDNTDGALFTVENGGIRVLAGGRYRVRTACLFFSPVDQRADPAIQFTRNGSPVAERSRQVYIRNTPNTPEADHQESSAYHEVLIALSANDLIAVQADGGSIPGGFTNTMLVAADSFLSVESTAGIIGPMGPQGPAGDGSGNMIAPTSGVVADGMLYAADGPSGTQTRTTGIFLDDNGRIPRASVAGLASLGENPNNPFGVGINLVGTSAAAIAARAAASNRVTRFVHAVGSTAFVQLGLPTDFDPGIALEFVNQGEGQVAIFPLNGATIGNIYGPSALVLGPGQAVMIARGTSVTDWELIFLTPSRGTTPSPGVPVGTITLQGTPWDPTSGAFPAGASIGFAYRISRDGEFAGETFFSQDLLVALVDAPSPVVFAGNWSRLDGGANVHSWAGMMGVIDDPAIVSTLERLTFRRLTSTEADFLGEVSESDGMIVGDEVANGTRVQMFFLGDPIPSSPVDPLTYGQATRFTSGGTFGGQATILLPTIQDPALTIVRAVTEEGTTVFAQLLNAADFTERPAAAPAGFRFFEQTGQISNFYPSLTTIEVRSVTLTQTFGFSPNVPVDPSLIPDGGIGERVLSPEVLGKLNRTDNITAAHQAFVDSVRAVFGPIPQDQLGTVLIHENAPSSILSDYYQAGNVFQQSGKRLYVAVAKPAQVAFLSTTAGNVNGTLVPGLLDGYNVSEIIQPNYGGSEFDPAFGFFGGAPELVNVTIEPPTRMSGGQLINQSVTPEKLSEAIQRGLLTEAEREGLQALLLDLLTLSNASIINTDPSLPIRFASMFEPDTPATTGSLANQIANGDISFTVQPAAGALRDDLTDDTNAALVGPGIEGGRFAIQGASGTIDIDEDGILVLMTYEFENARTSERNFLFAIGDATSTTGAEDTLPCGLALDSNGLVWVGHRAGQEPSTRQVQRNMYAGGVLEERLPGNEAEEFDFTLPDPLPDGDAGRFPLTATVTFETYGNGSFIERRTENVVISARATTGPVQNVTLLPNGPANGTRAVTLQYIADDPNPFSGQPHDVIRVGLQPDTAPNFGPDTHIYETRITGLYTITETIPATPDQIYDIPLDDETEGNRYTVALHLFRNSGDDRLSVRAAVNGHLGSSGTTLIADTGWDATRTRFTNPKLWFGSDGMAANTTALALQRVLIARALGTPSEFRVDQLSGAAALALYGLGHPVGGRMELLGSGVRWEGPVNGGAALPGTNAVIEIDISAADASGRPALAFTADDVTQGRLVVEFIVTDGTRVFVVRAPGDLRAYGATATNAGRLRFAADDVSNPSGEDIVVSANRVRFDSDLLAKQFAGTATYAISIVQR